MPFPFFPFRFPFPYSVPLQRNSQRSQRVVKDPRKGKKFPEETFLQNPQDIPIFEFFGIFLFLDDIIIICLLIFLYREQVDDQLLYIILFLLLFS